VSGAEKSSAKSKTTAKPKSAAKSDEKLKEPVLAPVTVRIVTKQVGEQGYQCTWKNWGRHARDNTFDSNGNKSTNYYSS
jgi:hypothetical protein